MSVVIAPGDPNVTLPTTFWVTKGKPSDFPMSAVVSDSATRPKTPFITSWTRWMRCWKGSIEFFALCGTLHVFATFLEWSNSNNPSVFWRTLTQSLKGYWENALFKFTWALMNVKNMFSRWMTALYYHPGANRTWQIWYNLFCLILSFRFRDLNQFHILPILQDAAITVKGSLSPQQLLDISCAAGARSFLARHIQ